MDSLLHLDVERHEVVCSLCRRAWDTRVTRPGADVEDEITLCPQCLLTTSHGHDLVEEPYPDEPPG